MPKKECVRVVNMTILTRYNKNNKEEKTMNVIKYRVSLDLFDTLSQVTIKVKKCDSACQIHITLTEHGKIYNISEGCYATFNAKKSDGNFVYDYCTIEGNTIVYDFGASIDKDGVCQVSACEGIVDCEVTLYNANFEQLTSPRFTLFIDGTVYNGEEIVSSPNFDAFKKSVEHKMDKFGNVTETDELIEVDLVMQTADGQLIPTRFKLGYDAYIERSGLGDLIFHIGEKVFYINVGSKHEGIDFNSMPLRNVATHYDAQDDDVANVGYVNKMCVPERITTIFDVYWGLENNKEYIASNLVSNVEFGYSNGSDIICSLIFTTAAEGTINITFPTGTKFIGTKPTFGNGETWELNIKNGVIVGGKVV